jgi:dynein heavy chain
MLLKSFPRIRFYQFPIVGKVPPLYDMRLVRSQIEKLGSLNPFNVCLRQEVDRMQRLLSEVLTTLTDLKLAIAGTIIMNEQLAASLDSLYGSRVPSNWEQISWASSSLGSWVSILSARCQQFDAWLNEGKPKSFWLAGFFNPQGLLTAVRQETTRASGWALDSVTLQNEITGMRFEDLKGPAQQGVYLHGFFLEGASWDKKANLLTESVPKVLYTPMPVICVIPVNNAPINTTQYRCPVYRNPRRTDRNYVFTCHLSSDKR